MPRRLEPYAGIRQMIFTWNFSKNGELIFSTTQRDTVQTYDCIFFHHRTSKITLNNVFKVAILCLNELSLRWRKVFVCCFISLGLWNAVYQRVTLPYLTLLCKGGIPLPFLCDLLENPEHHPLVVGCNTITPKDIR